MAERNRLTFVVADYIVFLLILIAPFTMAILARFTGDRQRTTDEYLMGNRQMRIFPIAVSFAISYLSGITILGNTAEIYFYGITFCFYYIGSSIAMTLTALLMVPVYHPLKITSVNQYLMIRHNSKALVMLAWLLQTVNQLIGNGIYLFAPATMMETAMGIPAWLSMVSIGIAATIYTTVGGFKTVIWTDVFQTVVVLAGILAILIKGSWDCGGFSEVWKFYKDGGRVFVDTNIDMTARQTVWGTTIGNTWSWLPLLACWPQAIQRINAVPQQRQAQLMLMMAQPMQMAISGLAIMCGLVAFGFYAKQGCDPHSAGYISSFNQIMPYFVMEILPYPGIPGLFLSSLVCGSLSNMSSSLSGLAALTWEDILADRFPQLPENRKALITKLITAVSGGIAIMFGLVVAVIGGTIMQVAFKLFGCIGPSLIVLFIGSALVPRLNWKSTFAGAIAALVLSCWIMFGSFTVASNFNALPTDISKCESEVFNVTSSHGNWNITGNFSMKSDKIHSFTTNQIPYENDKSMTTEVYDTEATNSSFLQILYSLSHFWYCFVGFWFGLIVAVSTSFLPGWSSQVVDERTLIPFVRKLYSINKEYKMVEMKSVSTKNELKRRGGDGKGDFLSVI